MARWIDLDAVMEKLAACGNDSDRNFRAECISAPYFPQEVAPVLLGNRQKNSGAKMTHTENSGDENG